MIQTTIYKSLSEIARERGVDRRGLKESDDILVIFKTDSKGRQKKVGYLKCSSMEIEKGKKVAFLMTETIANCT